MSASQDPHDKARRELARLVLAVAGESVTMVKRSVPEQALTMKKPQEWSIYLEFLKMLFNLADRLIAFYVPIQERPYFMNNLEDAVAHQLKAVLALALGPDTDTMEVTFTIGKTVAESRQIYERFTFDVMEDSSKKEACLKVFGERIAEAMQVPGNALVITTATMCASAAVPAMKAVFEGTTNQRATSRLSEVGEPISQAGLSHQAVSGSVAENEIKLISVISAMEGEEVETRWGLHPRFRQDLKPDEVRELTRLMNRLTRILGERYAAVAFSEDWAAWHQKIGHA
jgi:hypothetical protein